MLVSPGLKARCYTGKIMRMRESCPGPRQDPGSCSQSVHATHTPLRDRTIFTSITMTTFLLLRHCERSLPELSVWEPPSPTHGACRYHVNVSVDGLGRLSRNLEVDSFNGGATRSWHEDVHALFLHVKNLLGTERHRLAKGLQLKIKKSCARTGLLLVSLDRRWESASFAFTCGQGSWTFPVHSSDTRSSATHDLRRASRAAAALEATATRGCVPRAGGVISFDLRLGDRFCFLGGDLPDASAAAAAARSRRALASLACGDLCKPRRGSHTCSPWVHATGLVGSGAS